MREIKLKLNDAQESWLENQLAYARGDVAMGTIMFDGDMTKEVDDLYEQLGIKTYQEKFYKNSRWVNRDWQKPEYENLIERLKVVKEKWEVTPEKIIEACNNEVEKAKQSAEYDTKHKIVDELREQIKGIKDKRIDKEDVIDILDNFIYEEEEY